MIGRKTTKGGPKFVLKNEILKSPEITSKIRVTVMETYLQHVNRETLPGYRKAELLELCGLISYKIKVINEAKITWKSYRN